MQPQKNIIDCYNKSAVSYGDNFTNELSKKHLDRILLQAFAKENAGKGTMIDLGCGPGQTTKFLSDNGVTDITGADLSPAMVNVAKGIHPSLHFEAADMLALHYDDNSFSSAIAFYSIVHFNYDQVKIAFQEIKKVLKRKGQFLFAFHTGDTIVHLDDFLGHPVNIDFYFFETNKIIELLTSTGFGIIDNLERAPYPGAEHTSRRAYIWAINN